MALTLLPVTILQGQSLSDAVDCTAGKLVRITMPAAWDVGVGLTFLLSSDNVFFNPWYRWIATTEMFLDVIPGSCVLIPQAIEGIAWIKFQSGTHKYPIPQSAQREFSIALLTP